MTTAIIVAAGSSTRFAGAQPKQFTPLLGKPLIIHTLETFDASAAIDNIVLVLSDEGLDVFESIRGEYSFNKLAHVVTGGASRAESVRNGLNTVGGPSDEIVLVHDGARPLVTADEIARTVEKSHSAGAACLVAAVTDTIKEIDGDSISRTVDRSRLRRALTPQAFKYDLLLRAFDSADLSDDVTDECFLVERLGVPVAMVEGSVWNIKVTHPEDVCVAEALLLRQGR